MFCNNCGSEVAGGIKFCPNCGQPITQPVEQSQPMVEQPQPVVQPQPVYSSVSSEMEQMTASNGGSGANVVALLCGIFGLILSIIAGPLFGIAGAGITFLLSVLGIIFGIAAKKGSAGMKGTGGMVCGIIGTVFSIIYAAGCFWCGSALSDYVGKSGTSIGLYGCIGGTFMESHDSLSKYVSASNDSSDRQLCDTVRSAILTAMSDPDVIFDDDVEYPKEDKWIDISKVMKCDVYGDYVADIIGTDDPSDQLKSGDSLEVYISGTTVVVRVDGNEDIYAGPIDSIDD